MDAVEDEHVEGKAGDIKRDAHAQVLQTAWLPASSVLNLSLGELQKYPVFSGLESFAREARLATGSHKPDLVVGTVSC